jgi:uncharacterized protein YebE (UPF0316 family)
LVIPMSADSLVAPLATASLAMASVGLWTLGVALAARGRKAAGAVVAAAEAVVFALAFTHVASGLDAPERVVAYAVGVAVGTIFGLVVDERLAAGRSELRVVMPGLRPSVIHALEPVGCSATWLTAEGTDGPVTPLFVAVDDSRLPDIVETVRRTAPEASWTVHPLDKGQAGGLPHHCSAGGGRRHADRSLATPSGPSDRLPREGRIGLGPDADGVSQ